MVYTWLFSKKFDEIIPLDKWKMTILSKVKALIPEEGGAPAGMQEKKDYGED